MQKKKPKGITRLMLASKYSWNGFTLAFKNESAFRQEFFLLIGALIFVFCLSFSWIERLLLIGAILFVMLIELINSAIECVVDRISLERHSLSGRAKDYGSAAVFIALILAIFIWIGVLIRHFG